MRNIRINEAESIFEVYWDCGDSYPDHHKYIVLKITLSNVMIMPQLVLLGAESRSL